MESGTQSLLCQVLKLDTESNSSISSTNIHSAFSRCFILCVLGPRDMEVNSGTRQTSMLETDLLSLS